MNNQFYQKPDLEKILKDIEVQPRQDHKNLLRKNLLAKAERLYKTKERAPRRSLFSFIVKPGLVFASIIGVVITIHNFTPIFNANPSAPEPSYFAFIEKAKAFAAANKHKLQYTQIHTVTKYLGPRDPQMPAEQSIDQEIWRDESGNERFILKEPGSRDNIGITKKDAAGNEFLYNELYELTGKEREDYDQSIGGKSPGPVYSVHPGKQLNYEKELEKLNNNIMCIKREKGKDFIGESLFTMDSKNLEIGDVMSHSVNTNKRFNILIDLSKAFTGDLNQEELLNLIDRYKASPLIQYQQVIENGKNYHVFTLKDKDFNMVSASSAEALADAKKMFDENYTVYKIYFNAETYLIDKMENTEISDQDRVRSSTGMTVEYQYSDENRPDLFDTQGFALVQVDSVFMHAFEEGTLEFQEGCYQNAIPLSDEDTEKYKNIFLQKAEKESRKNWEHPLSFDQFYYLPE